MNQQNQTKTGGFELNLDYLQILRALLHYWWVLLTAALLGAGVMYVYSHYYVTPQYRTSAMMYVNVSKDRTNNGLNGSEISMARYLTNIYAVIIKAPSTLNMVREVSGLPYSSGQLSSMIAVNSINDTEVFQITVTCPDPQNAKEIIDTVIQVLPGRIEEIVEGSSTRVVSAAGTPTAPISPNHNQNVTTGAVTGLLVSALIIVLIQVLDTTIHDENYLEQTYGLPVLAVIPNMHQKTGKSSYYYQKNYYKERSGSGHGSAASK